jgi:hypothetical protein
MKDEISRIINEVAVSDQTLRPEWCTAIRSRLNIEHLQSSYQELYSRHMETPFEVTSEARTDIIKKYSLLHSSYLNLVRGQAVLKDEFERTTRQLTKPANVCNTIARGVLPT